MSMTIRQKITLWQMKGKSSLILPGRLYIIAIEARGVILWKNHRGFFDLAVPEGFPKPLIGLDTPESYYEKIKHFPPIKMNTTR